MSAYRARYRSASSATPANGSKPGHDGLLVGVRWPRRSWRDHRVDDERQLAPIRRFSGEQEVVIDQRRSDSRGQRRDRGRVDVTAVDGVLQDRFDDLQARAYHGVGAAGTPFG